MTDLLIAFVIVPLIISAAFVAVLWWRRVDR